MRKVGKSEGRDIPVCEGEIFTALAGYGQQSCKFMPMQEAVAFVVATEVHAKLYHSFRKVSSLLLIAPQLFTG